jgi:hypothetical protein
LSFKNLKRDGGRVVEREEKKLRKKNAISLYFAYIRNSALDFARSKGMQSIE